MLGTRPRKFLREVREVIRPLSAASFRLQRDENTLDDVVISFHEIYNAFALAPFDKDILIACLERRWHDCEHDCEQPLFILGLFLHPAHVSKAAQLLVTKGVRRSQVTSFAIYYYRRLISEDYGNIREEMEQFLDGDLTKAKASQWRGSFTFSMSTAILILSFRIWLFVFSQSLSTPLRVSVSSVTTLLFIQRRVISSTTRK